MFIGQLVASALVWAVVVFVLAKRRLMLFARMAELSRGRRAGLAAGLLVCSIGLLALGMGALAVGGLTPSGLTWWGWPTITAVGAAFVVLQTLALVPLVLNAAGSVTEKASGASDRVDAERP